MNGQRTLFVFFRREIVPLSIILISAAGMLVCLSHLHLIMYNIVITFFLMLVYSIPLWPLKKIHFVRRIGFVKTILLSLTWAHVTTMIPLQKTISHLMPAEVIIYFCRFVFVLMLCIIFDKRDMAMDKIRGMHSLATDLSGRALHLIMIMLFWLFSFMSAALLKYGIELKQSIGLLITAVLTFIVYLFSRKKQGYFFYYFLVDGLMLFSALITYLLSI